jgi:hypothetical protein
MLGQEFVDDKDEVEDIVGSGKGEWDRVVMWS